MIKNKYYMWHVTHHTWHVTHEMLHMTCDMWGRWTFSQISAPYLLRFGSVGSLNQLITKVFVEQPQLHRVSYKYIYIFVFCFIYNNTSNTFKIKVGIIHWESTSKIYLNEYNYVVFINDFDKMDFRSSNQICFYL